MRKTTLLLILFAFSGAFASGLSKPVLVGPKAIGMGGAFVAVADDPTAIFHNPAGITQVKGQQIQAGIDGLISQLDHTPTGSPTVESADREFIPVPQLSYVVDVFRPLSLGFGIFFPHGNGGTYSTASANPLGNPNEGRIYSMEITPAFGLEILKGLSVGGSLRIIRVSEELKGQFFGPPLGTLDNLSISGWDVGMSAGLHYRPCNMFAFGFNYRSSVDVNLTGAADFSDVGILASTVVQTLPSLYTVGFSFTPVEALTLGLMYGFEQNSEIDQVPVTLTGFGTLNLNYGWQSSHTIHFGGDYQLFKSLAVRAGFAKDLNDSVSDQSMNRIVGDIAATEVSAGLSYTWSRYTFAGTWNGRFGTRDIPNNGTNVAPGNYDAFVNMVSFAVTAKL